MDCCLNCHVASSRVVSFPVLPLVRALRVRVSVHPNPGPFDFEILHLITSVDSVSRRSYMRDHVATHYSARGNSGSRCRLLSWVLLYSGSVPSCGRGSGMTDAEPCEIQVHPGGIGKVWYVLVGGFLIPHSSPQVFCAHQEAETPMPTPPKVTQCLRLRLGLRQTPPVHTLFTSILRGPGLLGVARNHGARWLLSAWISRLPVV